MSAGSCLKIQRGWKELSIKSKGSLVKQKIYFTISQAASAVWDKIMSSLVLVKYFYSFNQNKSKLSAWNLGNWKYLNPLFHPVNGLSVRFLITIFTLFFHFHVLAPTQCDSVSSKPLPREYQPSSDSHFLHNNWKRKLSDQNFGFLKTIFTKVKFSALNILKKGSQKQLTSSFGD